MMKVSQPELVGSKSSSLCDVSRMCLSKENMTRNVNDLAEHLRMLCVHLFLVNSEIMNGAKYRPDDQDRLGCGCLSRDIMAIVVFEGSVGGPIILIMAEVKL